MSSPRMLHPDACVATVVLCTYNRSGQLSNAVASLFRQSLPDAQRFEIVVVDDGSADETQVVVAELSVASPVPLCCIRVPHGGVAAARNAGVAHARGRWVAFFDDDQEAEPGWLAALVRQAEENGADCVAGRIDVVLTGPSAARPDRTILKLLGDNSFMARGVNRPGRPIPEVVPGTGNALARRALFARIGPFDPSLPYGEDAEWFRRARRAGARIVYASDAVVRHLTPPARLTRPYLFSVAARGAASRAADDLKDGGRSCLIRICALRAVHTAVSALRIPIARLAGDADAALGRACSLRYSLAYLAAAGRLLFCRGNATAASAGRDAPACR